MDNIRKSLVTRELTAALNEVLSDYNPLSEIQNDEQNATNPNLNEFSRRSPHACASRSATRSRSRTSSSR